MKTRKPQRDLLMQLLHVSKRDAKGRATVVEVPGTDAKRYRVILRRNGRTISAECALEAGHSLGHITCRGNRCARQLCKHSMAAIEFAIREQRMKGHWCETIEDAQRLHKMLGGSIFTAKSYDGNGHAIILVTKERK
jgi:hypothetical protein